MGKVFNVSRWCLGVVAFGVMACGAPPEAGCYELDWAEFGPKEAVPDWLVPFALQLEATDAAQDRFVVNPPFEIQLEASGDGAVMSSWDGILYDRTWTMVADSIDIILKDLGYSEWHIRLGPTSPDRWRGQAVYTTTIGGGQRLYEGVVEAFSCDEGAGP